MTQVELNNGDRLERRRNALVCIFAGEREVLSSGPLNGGQHDDLKYIFNEDIRQGTTGEVIMKAPSYCGHLAAVATELGLDPKYAAGMSTAASMDNAAISTLEWDGYTVTAAVTAGIDVNGGRAGDRANWNERDGKFHKVAGTINIMLFVDACLTPGALARALITATEAKTAAVMELALPSRYSEGLATGSGTDSIIVTSDITSKIKLTEAGNHYKLGELIGRTVKGAVKRALFLQTGASAERQFSVIRRLERFGLNRADIQRDELHGLSENEAVVTAAVIASLLDELEWGLMTLSQAEPEILRQLDKLNCITVEHLVKEHLTRYR